MKNSIFTRYISVFLIIIFISFTILVAVVSSMTIQSENDNRQKLAETTAEYITEYIRMGMNEIPAPVAFERYVAYKSADISRTVGILSGSSEKMTVMLTTSEGKILISSGNSVSGRILDGKTLAGIGSGEEALFYGDIGGLLSKTSGIFIKPVITPRTEEVTGAVIVCFSAGEADALTFKAVRTIVLVSLWIMIASFTAIYFITERTVSPLKEMSRATKQFANGKFDVRIPVKGNDEITELAIAFNTMAESLSRQEYTRSTFLANVSHDLRTPMTTISGFIDGIQSGAIPPEKQDYYLGIIAQEVRRLSRLVSSLLDISRIQAGDRKFEKADFDICEMARLILISFESKIDEKNLDIEFDAPDELTAYSDKDAIYQVLYNICDNGMKFSREGGKFRITIRDGGDSIAVSVYNEGVGISEEDLPYVFDRFYKSDKSRGLDKTGVGLGLYICKTITDSLGGKLFVKSEYGKYCEFTMILEKGRSK